MRLFYSPPSPFATKVRMAAHHCGIALDCVVADTAAEPAELLKTNPLGKIPALVLDNGEGVYDSRVICEYFDRMSGNLLIPQQTDAWLAAKRIEATADGVMDAAILTLYEARYRPEELRHQPWVDKQWKRAMRGLHTLEDSTHLLQGEPNIGHFAVAALLSWFDLRFSGRWEAEHPKLKAWLQAFPSTFPAYEDLKAKAA